MSRCWYHYNFFKILQAISNEQESKSSFKHLESAQFYKYGVTLLFLLQLIILSLWMQHQPYQELRKKILEKKFTQIDLSDVQVTHNLINMMQSLQSSPDNFKLIKLILLNFGFPSMIFLDKFYAGLSKQTRQTYEEDLQLLASIAKQMANDKCVDEIQFLFQLGFSSEGYKKKKKSSEEKQFIEDVARLSEEKKKFKDNLISRAELQNYVEITLKKYEPIVFMLQSFRSYYQKSYLDQTEQPSVQITYYQGVNQSSQINMDQSYVTTPIIDDSTVDDINTNPDESIDQQEVNDSQTSDRPFSIDTSSERSILPESIEKDNKEYICCRTFFYQDEHLKENESESLAYLNCKFPYKVLDMLKIKEVMCSLLNSDGGNIFIGINKYDSGQKIVEGDQYSENEKQNVLRTFRQISQTIQPDIITQKMYRVDFIPLKNFESEKFIPGAFVIRINVRYGIRDDIYSYRENSRDFFPFRNQNQIIQKQGRLLLKILRQRIKNPLSIPIPIHSGSCKNPELGEQIHESGGFEPFMKIKTEKTPIGYKPKPAWPPLPTEEKRSSSPMLMKKNENTRVSESSTITQSSTAWNTSTNTEKGFTKMLPDDIYSQQSQSTRKQQSKPKQCYFFVVGVNEKQISPVLEKKGILHQVKMESTKQSKLVIKAFSQEIASKLRKILKKIVQKYAANNIKIFEITLCLEVSNPTKAKSILSNFKEKYEFFRSTVRFQYFRDSLKAFLLLESEMEVRFIQAN